jgi:hypothetical protein
LFKARRTLNPGEAPEAEAKTAKIRFLSGKRCDCSALLAEMLFY